MKRIISVDIGQLLFGFAKMLISPQIEHDTGAVAFRIGQKLFFFDSHCFHGKYFSRFPIFRNLLLILSRAPDAEINSNGVALTHQIAKDAELGRGLQAASTQVVARRRAYP